MLKCLWILLALSLSGVALAKDSWQLFKPKDGSYRIAFPGRPQKLSSTDTLNGHKVPVEFVFCEIGDRAYAVIKLDVRKALGKMQDREKAILAFSTLYLDKDKTHKIFLDRRFELDGHPGRYVVIVEKEKEGQIYAVVREGQLYMVFIAGVRGKTVDESTNKFVHSFKLL